MFEMVLSVILRLMAGLGIFLYGMHYMSDGLQRLAGARLRKVLTTLTSNRFKAVLAGLGLTVLIQSSSATTVSAVGFVNAGLMSLRQAIGVVMGANIGTTITAWIISIKIVDAAPIFIAVGCVMALFARPSRQRRIGQVLLGIGLVFFGMIIMKEGVAPLKSSTSVKEFFNRFSGNPFLGLVAGVIMTCVLQSSSATIAVAIALAKEGLIDLNAAVPLIIGDNIGTTITAQLASLGTRVESRRTAMSHTLFNLLGALWAFPLAASGLYPKLITWITPIAYEMKTAGVFIANAHTCFNVANTVLFIGLVKLLERASIWLVPEGKEAIPITCLETHLLSHPETALAQVRRAQNEMLARTRECVRMSVEGLLHDPPKPLEDEVHELEREGDAMQKEITLYLVALGQEDLSPEESDQVPTLLHSVNDLERISDHALNIAQANERLIRSGEGFTPEQRQEIGEIYSVLEQMFQSLPPAIAEDNLEATKRTLELEKSVDRLRQSARTKYLDRLQAGASAYFPGMIYLNVVDNFEKMGDHLTNIAQAAQRRFHYTQPRKKNGFTEKAPGGNGSAA